MKEFRRIVDTTLRDGLQSPGIFLAEDERVRLALLLDRAGVYQIEAGIPAMGESEIRPIERILHDREHARISLWSRLNTEDVRIAARLNPDVIHISIPVSYLHIYTKLGKNKTWVINKLQEVLDIVSGSTAKLSVGFEDASRADLAFLMRVLLILEPFGTDMIRLADTVGITSPCGIRDLVRSIHNFTRIPLEIHAHNDFGMAVANTAQALRSGCLYADTTLCGIGERSGNCEITALLDLLHPVYDFGINRNVLEEAEAFLRQTNMLSVMR